MTTPMRRLVPADTFAFHNAAEAQTAFRLLTPPY